MLQSDFVDNDANLYADLHAGDSDIVECLPGKDLFEVSSLS